MEAARGADVVVMALGEDGFQTGEGRSQVDIGLKGLQEELLRAVLEVNKKVVVVLMNGRPLAIPGVVEAVPAVVEAWHGGSQAGHAIAQVLFGDYNPSGKLPMSFPRHVGQLPYSYNHKNTGRPNPVPEVFWSHYADAPNDPLFPFGFGLSYTTFSYSDPRVSAAEMSRDGELRVSVTLTNTGPRAGTEVVQLYVRDLVGSVTRPVKELKGFQKVELAAGQSREVVFTLKASDLAFYTAAGRWEAEPGAFKVFVGGNSRDLKEAGVQPALRPSSTRGAERGARPRERLVEALDAVAAALGQVAAAAAAAAEVLDGRLQERGDVVGQALGLREDQVGLVGAAAEERHRGRQAPRGASRAGAAPRPASRRSWRRRRRGTRRVGAGPWPWASASRRRASPSRARSRRALRAALRSGEVVLELAGDGRELVERGRQRRDELVEDLLPAREGRERPAAADEVHARAALVALERGDHDDADLGRGARVRAAAGLTVEALGLDDADVGHDAVGRLAGRTPAPRRRSATTTRTGRACHTTSLASRSAARACSSPTKRSRSTVVSSLPGGRRRWRPAPPPRTPSTAGAARGAAACGRGAAPASTRPCTRSPASGRSRTWRTSAPSSITASTRASPSVPVSHGCPPLSA